MGINPDTGNYTVPGGVKLFFDDGSGYRDLGNIAEIDMEPGSDELEHFTNRPGKRTKDKIVTLEEKLMFNFTFDEVNVENMKLFFRGGDLTNVGSGTASITDRKATLNGTAFVSLGDYFGLTGVSVRQFLDYCLLYDKSALAYVDNSVEADSLDGSAFPTIEEADDVLYLGKATQFKEVYFDFATPGSYGAVVVKYWNGAAWAAVSDLAGAAAALAADGKMNWTLPADWEKTTVDSKEAYYIQITCTTPWTTPATINEIRQACVQNTDWILDAGSSEEIGRAPGRIARLAGGFLTADEEVKVSFTYATWTSQKMAIAAVGTLEGAAKLEVHPSAGRGQRFDVVFGRVSLKAKGSAKLDDKDWLKMPMTMEVLDNSTDDPTYPFGYFQAYGESL